jgi:hypothetical protein
MKNPLDEDFANFVAEGDEDYIGLWQIVMVINDYLGINPKKVAVAEAEKFWSTLSDFVTRMLNNGFIAVDLTREGGYIAWPEQEPKQVMAKIRNLVVAAHGKLDDMMYGVWFNKINKQPRQRKQKPT